MNKEQLRAIVQEFLQLLDFTPESFEITEDAERRQYSVDIAMITDQERIIGRRGAVLEALQTLVNAIAQKGSTERGFHVVVDVNGYRDQRRKELLLRVERQLQEKWLADQVELWPMNGLDRRYVHEHYARSEDFTTESRGIGMDRRVVIRRVTKQ